ncbi:SagB family peptide dehydrogenase [Nonomuraea polychroma]|uniref:SagB family peptide dehydrogenase n=1 Tax=Nonomuraea polychroma TaxID=46176 RepID=UPI003D8B51E6
MNGIRMSTGCTELLRLRPGVYSAVSAKGILHLLTWQRSESFTEGATWKQAVLRHLAAAPTTVADLCAAAPEHEVIGFLKALRASGWLMTTVCYDERPLYTLRPLRPPTAAPADHFGDLVLSRFAIIRREEHDLLVESPLAWAHLAVHDPAVTALLGRLTHLLRADAGPGPLPPEAAARTLRDLRWTGLVVPAGDSERHLHLWQPHELWFHHRTRMSGPGPGYRRGPGESRLDAPPTARVVSTGAAIDLVRPDLDELRRHDPPLAHVMEERRSIREHDDSAPITVAQLGELLYRCARVRSSFELDATCYSNRPYPSGGAVYELEIYPVVRLVDGLDPGMYHYNAYEHRLRLVRGPGPEVTRLLHMACRATAVESQPQVLIVIAAQFARIMARYQDIPYSLILKHVGVLFQNIQLTATAMGLAACALGAGEAASFVEATGLDHTMEGSVGEIVLGSRPASAPGDQN